MKMRVMIQKTIEVETSNPVFDTLLKLHQYGACGTDEQYEEATVVLEGITGYPVWTAGTKFNEVIAGVYTEDGETVILEY